MVSISKIIGVMSCGCLLCLGLANTAQAEGTASASTQQMNGTEGGLSQGGKTITGDVVRVEYGNYFVKGQDGKEVRMHTDKTTLMMGQIRKGDRIEAKVNDKNHALLIRPVQ
jgi:hypothetical protein